MAALSQTPANVAIGSSTTPTRIVQYGEAVTQGQPVYAASDGKWYRCDANDGAIKARCGGIALTPGGVDAFGLIALPGTSAGQSYVHLGATLAVGTVYAVGQGVGEIDPIADTATNDYVTTIGIAISTAILDFQVAISNVQKA